MIHVFVETNWVFEILAPTWHQKPEARRLLEYATTGHIRLYLPGICLPEAEHAMQQRYGRRQDLNPLRKFVGWSETNGHIDPAAAEHTRRALQSFETHTQRELNDVPNRLAALRIAPGLDIFPLSTAMLEGSLKLPNIGYPLKPFDQTILAAILARADELVSTGVDRFVFCELDDDLRPLAKDGSPRKTLVALYEARNIIVQPDFLIPNLP